MSRSLDAATLSAINSRTVSPVYLVEMGFTTPVRYSTKEMINWGGYNWTAASMRVAMNKNPSIAVFNEGTTFGDTVLADGVSGRQIKIYKAFEYTKRNLLTYTEAFDNAAWSKAVCTVTQNDALDPQGNSSADKFIPNNLATDSKVIQVSVPTTIGEPHVFSVYAKAAGFDLIYLTTNVNGTWGQVGFDLSTGTVDSENNGYTGVIENYNDWYRISLYSSSAAFAAANFQVRSLETGDGTSGYHLWGAQLEESSTLTEYQPVIAGSYTPTGSEPTGYTAPILLFDGEMAAATIRDVVSISCKEFPPLYTPRHFVSEPIFNHVPAVGTRFVTPQGVIVLEGR